MGDQDKPSELSLSTFYGINAIGDLSAQNSVKIDEKLLIDANQLAIGQMISEGPHSVVYQGL